ncbi:VOC family protein [Microbacterium aurantiacum]|uniref:Glyoxalase n=1 Tax=Microbacterium aurantiacum TaxID=162393 RepID=A0A0M9VL23_9MICO|nr:VOC family protein [Microbacterium chocolatum]ANG86193.1 glyoxalase [Microbacterium chocolatum]KOS10709.1 glyoxalase [Microbacterium chocolatum]
MSAFGTPHHVEVQVADLDRAVPGWEWLLGELGYEPFQRWDGGRSWRLGATYIVVTRAPREGAHDRRMPGLSHLAFHAGSAESVEQLWRQGPSHGWMHLYADRHPFAGGEDHYAAFLEDAERFKVELVASDDASVR